MYGLRASHLCGCEVYWVNWLVTLGELFLDRSFSCKCWASSLPMYTLQRRRYTSPCISSKIEVVEYPQRSCRAVPSAGSGCLVVGFGLVRSWWRRHFYGVCLVRTHSSKFWKTNLILILPFQCDWPLITLMHWQRVELDWRYDAFLSSLALEPMIAFLNIWVWLISMRFGWDVTGLGHGWAALIRDWLMCCSRSPAWSFA